MLTIRNGRPVSAALLLIRVLHFCPARTKPARQASTNDGGSSTCSRALSASCERPSHSALQAANPPTQAAHNTVPWNLSYPFRPPPPTQPPDPPIPPPTCPPIHPPPGLTKLVSNLTKEGHWAKALEVYEALDAVGVRPDTTITNAAISSCDKGGQWEAALALFRRMSDLGMARWGGRGIRMCRWEASYVRLVWGQDGCQWLASAVTRLIRLMPPIQLTPTIPPPPSPTRPPLLIPPGMPSPTRRSSLRCPRAASGGWLYMCSTSWYRCAQHHAPVVLAILGSTCERAPASDAVARCL